MKETVSSVSAFKDEMNRQKLTYLGFIKSSEGL